MKPEYNEFDHSGDIGVEAWGETAGEMLENLSRGLFSLICRNRVAGTTERRIYVTADSLEGLIVDWLSEIISLVDIHGEVYGAVRVEACAGSRAEGIICGEPYDSDRHELRLEVKAATYHGLKVEHSAGRYHTRVIFDL